MADWMFRILEPGKPPLELPVSGGMSFGRHPESSCQLSDPRVSGRHARVVEIGGTLLFEDVGSSNKSQVDGGPTLERGEQLPLRPGLTLRMGDTLLEVFDPNELPATLVDEPSGATVTATLVETDGAADLAAEEAAKKAAEEAARRKAEEEAAEKAAEEAARKKAEEEAAKKAAEEAARKKAEEEAAQKAAEEAARKKAEEEAAKKAAEEAAKKKAEEEAAKKAAEEAAKKKAAEKPPEAAAPVPAESPGTDTDLDDGSTMGTIATMAGSDAPMGDLAKQAALEAARPRLVVSDEALGGTVDIRRDEFSIGRSKRRSPDHLIDHDGVSGLHAKVTFNGSRFFLEDLESTNGTFLGEEMLAPQTPREIHSDVRVRFGPIEALFVVDVDADGRPVPTDSHGSALAVLVDQGKISGNQRTRASGEAEDGGRHAGEVLIASNLIQPADWVDALEQARIRGAMVKPGAGGGSSNRMLVVGLVAAALAIGAALFFAFR